MCIEVPDPSKEPELAVVNDELVWRRPTMIICMTPPLAKPWSLSDEPKEEQHG